MQDKSVWNRSCTWCNGWIIRR